jgi:hypothetical protein
MPNIEIISLRFNLDKDEDRRLFEALQKRSDPGKRNEFLKHALLECLAQGVAGGKAVRTSRKQAREPALPPAVRLPEEPGPELTPAPGHEAPQPVSGHIAIEQAPGGHKNGQEADSEAVGLVASFVQ